MWIQRLTGETPHAPRVKVLDVNDARVFADLVQPTLGQNCSACHNTEKFKGQLRMDSFDALAKGVFILGPDAGMALIERTPGVQGVIVGANNEVLISSGLKNRLILLAPPTDAP